MTKEDAWGQPLFAMRPTANTVRAELAEHVLTNGRGEMRILKEHAWRIAALPDEDRRLMFIAAAAAIDDDVLGAAPSAELRDKAN